MKKKNPPNKKLLKQLLKIKKTSTQKTCKLQTNPLRKENKTFCMKKFSPKKKKTLKKHSKKKTPKKKLMKLQEKNTPLKKKTLEKNKHSGKTLWQKNTRKFFNPTKLAQKKKRLKKLWKENHSQETSLLKRKT